MSSDRSRTEEWEAERRLAWDRYFAAATKDWPIKTAALKADEMLAERNLRFSAKTPQGTPR